MRGKCNMNVILAFVSHISPFCRYCVGNSFRSEVEHGFFTTSSLRTPLPTRRIRCVSICLGKASQLDCSPPVQVPELVSQRRRWLNGSFFAAIHGTVKFRYIYRSSHSFARKFWIHVELLYQTFNLIFSWFALVSFPMRVYRFCLRTSLCFVLCLVQGNFFISFFVLTNALEDPAIIGGKGIEVINTILKYSYGGLLLTCFILALGNRPQGSKGTYTIAFIGYAIFTLYMTVCYRD